MPRVFMHIGAGKTGTSAIQTVLAQNRESLARSGLIYPALPGGLEDRARRGVSSSGNAHILGWFCNRNIKGGSYTVDGAVSWIEDSVRLADGRDLVFSSEALQFARAEEAKELVEIFRRKNYHPEIIFYVRHLLDHAIAEYLQHVKMGYATLAVRDRVDSLVTFLPYYRCGFVRVLRIFSGLVPRDSIHVRLYDSERSQLIPNFCALLGLPALLTDKIEERVVNRSPSSDELPFFEYVARQPDGLRLCRQLSDLLLNAESTDQSPFVVPEDCFERFSVQNSTVLSEINDLWLLGADKLLMKSDRVLLGAPIRRSADAVTAHFGLILTALLRSTLSLRPGQSSANRGPRRPDLNEARITRPRE